MMQDPWHAQTTTLGDFLDAESIVTPISDDRNRRIKNHLGAVRQSFLFEPCRQRCLTCFQGVAIERDQLFDLKVGTRARP